MENGYLLKNVSIVSGFFFLFLLFRYLATGECGIIPTIKVWELDTTGNNEQSNSGGTVISEFSGHKYAVNCVVSTPNLNNKYTP